MQQTRADLNRIPEQPEVAIHALRRRMKKLQSLLGLVDHLAHRDTARQIKRLLLELKNAFAGQRDQDVLTSLARKMGGRPLAHQFPPRQTIAAPWLMSGCHAAAAALEKILMALPIQRLPWAEIRESHERTACKARQRWEKARDDPTATHWHACRKQTKALYYQLLFLRLVKGKRRRKIRHAREFGQLLGKHHDLHVFQTTVESRKLLSRSLKTAIEKREKKLSQRALEVGRKMHGEG